MAEGGDGGTPGYGGGGADGDPVPNANGGEDTGPAGNGADAGGAGGGGEATAELEDATVVATVAETDSVTAASGDGGYIGNGTITAGSGGYAGGDSGDTYSGSLGGTGGNGANASNTGDAAAIILDDTFQTGAAIGIDATANGGSGGAGTGGGSGGSGVPAGAAGNGGDGGNGGSATAEIVGDTIAETGGSSVQLNASASAGDAGRGGDGGSSGVASVLNVDTGTDFSTYGAAGSGGNGGNGGDASAIISADTITGATSVELIASAQSGIAGTGGLAGDNHADGSPNSTPGTAGSDGFDGEDGIASISITDNDITLAAGAVLSISAHIDDHSSGGSSVDPAPLGTSDFTFTGNVFQGAGDSSLDLSGVQNGAATIDVAHGKLSIGGSPEDNSFSGFDQFTASQGSDLFVDGSGDQTYNLDLAAGAAALDFATGHGNDSISGFGPGDIIDFAGFGGDFDTFGDVEENATNVSGGVLIATPLGGSVLLGGIAASDLTASEFTFTNAGTGSDADGIIAGSDGAAGDAGFTPMQYSGGSGGNGQTGEAGAGAANVVAGRDIPVAGGNVLVGAIGGNGGAGGDGGTGADISSGVAGNGGRSGTGGEGGSAVAQLTGSSIDVSQDGVIEVSAASGKGGAAGDDDLGGPGGSSYAGGTPGNGGAGSDSGNGGEADADLENDSFTASAADQGVEISVIATGYTVAAAGATGGAGGFVAHFDDGDTLGNGGNGGNGGDGGNSTSRFEDNTVATAGGQVNITAEAISGAGGSGGDGGNAGALRTSGDDGNELDLYGIAGDAGDGGNGGDAAAIVSGNTITANAVALITSVQVGAAGAGGMPGYIGSDGTPGTFGVDGTAGTALISITDNDVTVAGGLSGIGIQAHVIEGQIDAFPLDPAPLDGSDFAFTGNSFVGDGASFLDLSNVVDGAATIDVQQGLLAIGGSDESSTIRGFATFDGSQGADLFVDGAGDQLYDDNLTTGTATFDFTLGHGDDTIAGFGAGGTIDFAGFGPRFQTFAELKLATTDTSDGALIATPDGGSVLLEGLLKADLDASEFTFELACYAAGTRVSTPGGEAAIETLEVGDLVSTASGARAIRWIGHRRVDLAAHPAPEKARPVRIRAQAFGSDQPRRDLYISPDHAVLVDGLLVPIKYLINGTTIAQQHRDEVTYWHIELDRHDILLAEGLKCESYLDSGNPNAFARNGIVQLHPEFEVGDGCEAIWEAAACAPMRISGPAVARIDAGLRRRAMRLGHASDGPSRLPSQPRARGRIDPAGLLDPQWYLSAHPDVAAAGRSAAAHYAGWGRHERRLPCAETDLLRGLGLVDEGTVAFTMHDVVAAGLDPVAHFCGQGWHERRRPNPYFDTGWYLDTHDVPAGMNPLLHYVLVGEARGLPPSRHFDPHWYRRRYGLKQSVSALAHYLKHRRTGGFSPLPSFDVEAYRAAHTATLRPDRDPYAHYLTVGRTHVRLRLDDALVAA